MRKERLRQGPWLLPTSRAQMRFTRSAGHRPLQPWPTEQRRFRRQTRSQAPEISMWPLPRRRALALPELILWQAPPKFLSLRMKRQIPDTSRQICSHRQSMTLLLLQFFSLPRRGLRSRSLQRLTGFWRHCPARKLSANPWTITDMPLLEKQWMI